MHRLQIKSTKKDMNTIKMFYFQITAGFHTSKSTISHLHNSAYMKRYKFKVRGGV